MRKPLVLALLLALAACVDTAPAPSGGVPDVNGADILAR